MMIPRERPRSVERGAIALSQALLIGPVSLVLLAWAQDWYVDVNGPGCPGTGTQVDPFCAIGDAVTAAADGDTIHIAPGTYLENIVLDKDLDLIGTGGDQVTVLDGNAAGRVVLLSNSAVRLEGVTITNGDANGAPGGGLLMDGASSLVLANSTVSGNSTFGCGHSGYYCGSGGGICSLGGSLVILDSIVTDNLGYFGSGIYCDGGQLILEGATINNPRVNVMGNSGASFTLLNSSITASGQPCYTSGGGVYLFESSLTLTNSALTNLCIAVFADYSDVEIVNATISGNESGVDVGESSLSVANSILSGGYPLRQTSSGVTVEYSLVEGGWPGAGNIDADPLFADPLNGNFRLLQGSPCIDAGSNVAVPPDILLDLDGRSRFIEDSLTPDTGRPGRMRPLVDMGAYEGPFFPGRHARRR